MPEGTRYIMERLVVFEYLKYAGSITDTHVMATQMYWYVFFGHLCENIIATPSTSANAPMTANPLMPASNTVSPKNTYKTVTRITASFRFLERSRISGRITVVMYARTRM